MKGIQRRNQDVKSSVSPWEENKTRKENAGKPSTLRKSKEFLKQKENQQVQPGT